MGQKSHADTSWLIALFNPDDSHHSQALRELEELTSPPSLSALALAELLVDFDKSDAISIPHLSFLSPLISPFAPLKFDHITR